MHNYLIYTFILFYEWRQTHNPYRPVLPTTQQITRQASTNSTTSLPGTPVLFTMFPHPSMCARKRGVTLFGFKLQY